MLSDAPSLLASLTSGCCWALSTLLLDSLAKKNCLLTSSMSTIHMSAPAKKTLRTFKKWCLLQVSKRQFTPRVQKLEEPSPQKNIISEDVKDTHFINYRTNPYMSKWRRRKVGPTLLACFSFVMLKLCVITRELHSQTFLCLNIRYNMAWSITTS